MALESILILLINIALYIVLLCINLGTKHAFDTKLDDYRKENIKTIEVFKDELFKKNRRFELKFDIYKGFAWKIPQIHWVITQFDCVRLTEAFENIWYQRVLVENFYGQDAKSKIRELREVLKSVQEKRGKINADLGTIFLEKMHIDQLRQRLNAILFTPPQNLVEIINRVSVDYDLNIRDRNNYDSQVRGIKGLMEEIQASFEKIYPLCEQLLACMANELKAEYELEP